MDLINREDLAIVLREIVDPLILRIEELKIRIDVALEKKTLEAYLNQREEALEEKLLKMIDVALERKAKREAHATLPD